MLKNTIMAAFQSKIGWKMPWKREYKIIVPFRSYPTLNRKIQKNRKKNLKIKNYHYGFISSQNTLENAEKEKKIKIIVPFCSYTTRNWKFQKNSKKIQKVKKYHYGLISSQDRLENDEKERK